MNNFRCLVCARYLGSEANMKAHLTGAAHTKAAAMNKKICQIPSDDLLQPRPSSLPSFFCGLCLVDCCYQHSYQQHLSGKGHQQRMDEQARLDAAPDNNELFNNPDLPLYNSDSSICNRSPIIQSDLCIEPSHTPIITELAHTPICIDLSHTPIIKSDVCIKILDSPIINLIKLSDSPIINLINIFTPIIDLPFVNLLDLSINDLINFNSPISNLPFVNILDLPNNNDFTDLLNFTSPHVKDVGCSPISQRIPSFAIEQSFHLPTTSFIVSP